MRHVFTYIYTCICRSCSIGFAILLHKISSTSETGINFWSLGSFKESTRFVVALCYDCIFLVENRLYYETRYSLHRDSTRLMICECLLWRKLFLAYEIRIDMLCERIYVPGYRSDPWGELYKFFIAHKVVIKNL